MSRRKVCVVTGSRAEYGLLYWVMRGLQNSPSLELQVIVTGMHLSPEFGLTYRTLEQDGFIPDKKVEMLLSADTATAISKSTALGIIGMADAF
ncbi:MAG: UDP-N-acetylglucosamine 2-epimerase, partial [Leptospiraceae bacterium]|nr:UDP-N-acetylglucosamine 2-epimerase [Leptospiraceae bacterium]